MKKQVIELKRNVTVWGNVQMPLKVGAEASYTHNGLVLWTDKVRKILEVTENYVRLETNSYYYTICLPDAYEKRKGLAA